MLSPLKLVLLLALIFPAGPQAHAGFSAKETRPTEDEYGLCGVAKRGLQEAIEKAQRELGKHLHMKPLLNNCAQALTKHYDDCSSNERLAQFGCKTGAGANTAAQPSGSGSGITGAADKMAGGLVEDANCKRRVSHCVSKGGYAYRGQGTNEDAWKKCLNGDKLSFSPIPNAQTPRDRDASARNQLLSEVYRAEKSYAECLEKRAKAAEDLARKTLQDSQAARSDGSRPDLSCVTKHQGNRECEVSRNGERFTPADGQREDGPIRDPEADKHNPALVKSANGHCSGTVLGDGQTVVTAGHCLDNGGRAGERQITVRDSLGQEHVVTARCSGQFDGVGYSDLAKCSLSQPIKANPVYFATHDPKIPGSGCVDDAYVKRCGTGFFEDLTNKPVTVYGYPSDQGLTRSTGTFTGTGTNGWLWKNGVLYNDLLCTGGCSGSGYIVDVNGQKVVVGAHSYNYVYRAGGGGGSIPTYQQWQNLRVQSVSTNKLADSSLLFQQLQ